MVRAKRGGARWVAPLLGVALVACVVVVYALIQVTAPSTGSTGAVTSTVSVPSSSGSVPASRPGTASGTAGSGAPVSTASRTTAPSSAAPLTSESLQTVTDSSGAESSGADSSAADTSVPPTPSPSGSAESGPMTTATSRLQGSGVTLPAAWSGEAKVTITVLGNCATGTTSGYTTPADLALDLPQNEASAVSPTATPTLPDDEPTLTLGVNAANVPSLSVYSSAIDDSGAFHRYWEVRLTPYGDRTLIQGTLITEAVDGSNPNIMVDAETSLQPCESSGTVGLPRPLAAGSSMTGWVSETDARLTLTARTTDGKRQVTVDVMATRKQ